MDGGDLEVCRKITFARSVNVLSDTSDDSLLPLLRLNGT